MFSINSKNNINTIL